LPIYIHTALIYFAYLHCIYIHPLSDLVIVNYSHILYIAIYKHVLLMVKDLNPLSALDSLSL